MNSRALKFRLLVLLASVASLTVGCAASASDLASTLPREISGHQTQITVVGDQPSGMVTDAALAALGKTRKDAAQATAIADPDVIVIAIAVGGVSGSDLRTALVEHWPANGPATSETVASKSVLVLVKPGGARTYFYVRGPVVYIVEAGQSEMAASALSTLK